MAPSAGACFASPAGGEIVVGGRKLVGSAQVREGMAFLQHGSILIRDNQDVVAAVTRGAAAAPNATSLADVLGRDVDVCEVADAVATGLGASVPEWTGAPDSTLVARFRSASWTWRR